MIYINSLSFDNLPQSNHVDVSIKIHTKSISVCDVPASRGITIARGYLEKKTWDGEEQEEGDGRIGVRVQIQLYCSITVHSTRHPLYIAVTWATLPYSAHRLNSTQKLNSLVDTLQASPSWSPSVLAMSVSDALTQCWSPPRSTWSTVKIHTKSTVCTRRHGHGFVWFACEPCKLPSMNWPAHVTNWNA